MKYLLFTVMCMLLLVARSQYPCENGLSGGTYPCNQVTMLAHMAPEALLAVEHNGNFLNDLWGWTDPETNKEYALVGLKDGVSFVDISDPVNPVLLGKLPESTTANDRISSQQEIHHGKSTWRDIKTFQNHAFIVSDLNGAHGLQVFDLTKLRGLDGTAIQTFEIDALHAGFGSAHNIAINEATGFAYIVGIYRNEGICSSGLYIMDINDPKQPEFVGCFGEDGYTHDAQCVIYEGPDTDYQGRALCFNSNEDTFTIVDVEDKSNPVMVSRNGYDNWRYSHQGWLSEDHRFFLMNDELDEMQYGHNPRTLIWNIEDLDNPELIGDYYNNEPAIDHNLYVHNNLVYESNYRSGLRVLTLDSIASGQLREKAFFDTYPLLNEISFGGSWSNYPYFESGTIIVSDMNNGLFLLQLDLQEDLLKSHPADWNGCIGNTATFEVSATGEDLLYQWQAFNGRNYINLLENGDFSGVQTPALSVLVSPMTSNYLYRCVILDDQKNRFDSYTATISVNESTQSPVADFNWTVTADGTFEFENLSEYGQNYLWHFSDGTTSNEPNPSVSFDPGLIEVSLTVTNECGKDSIYKEARYILQLDQNVTHIYPNPARDFITVNAEIGSDLKIIDMSGKTLLISSIQQDNPTINISTFETGLYHVIMRISSDQTIKQKLIIR